MSTRAINKTTMPRLGGLSPSSLVSLARHSSVNKFRTVQILLLVADGLMVGLAFLMAYHARFSDLTSRFFDQNAWREVAFYSSYVFFLIPLWLIL